MRNLVIDGIKFRFMTYSISGVLTGVFVRGGMICRTVPFAELLESIEADGRPAMYGNGQVAPWVIEAFIRSQNVSKAA